MKFMHVNFHNDISMGPQDMSFQSNSKDSPSYVCTEELSYRETPSLGILNRSKILYHRELYYVEKFETY